MLPNKKYLPEDVLRIAWQRKWLILVPFVLVACATYGAARFLPNRYRSETVILVVPQRVPDSYVRATVTARIEDRLRTIQQQILSRTRLEAIIQELNLYPTERQRGVMQDVVDEMRNDIDLQIVRGDAFRLSYASDNPRTAMQVTDQLASLFIKESLQDRAVLATQTNQFLQTQLDQARRRLVEHEEKLSQYQRLHAGELPADRQSNLQVLQNLEMQVQAIIESINRDRDRRVAIERELSDLTLQASSGSTAGSIPLDDPAAVTGAPAAARLDAARAQLRGLELRLKPEHPDIGRMKRLIRDLEATVQAEALERPLSPAPGARPATPEEQARQKRVTELQAEQSNLDLQLAGKQSEEKRIRGLIAASQGRVGATPLREAEMIALTRDYDTLQKNYQSLLAKQEDSKMAANLELAQAGEQFQVLDPARLPERPYSPNRPFIDLVGALAGLGLGVGLAALLEYRDKSFHAEEDVVTCLALPVLALVPVMRTSAERRRSKRRRTLLSLVGLTAFVIAAAAGALAWKLGWLARLMAR